jgi:hypothetical protein
MKTFGMTMNQFLPEPSLEVGQRPLGTLSVVIRSPDTASDVLLGKPDPSILAFRIAEGIRSGVRSMIDACILLNEGSRLFKADPGLRDQFIRALADENVIPKRSARLGGFEKSKLSMLRKIGRNADLLLDDKIFRYLEPGRSVLFHTIRLYEELQGDHESRLARLVELFEAQGSLSREFLIEQIKLAERAGQSDVPQAVAPWVAGDCAERYDLILITLLDRRVSRRLGEHLVDHPPFMSIHERVANRAIGVAIARLVDLPVIENKLLPGCGFDRVAQLFLLRNPVDPDVTDAQVIVVARRGWRHGDCLVGFQWLFPGEPLDAVALASRLVPHAKHKLHLFASAESDGWCSIVGDANWRHPDE